jgi:hypothetical protein
VSDAPKQYANAFGMVQAFVKEGVRQPATRTATVNGGTVTNFTIKTLAGNYVDIALWQEYAHVAGAIQEGFAVYADGVLNSRESNGKTFHQITPYRLVVMPTVARQEREVVNQAPAAAPVAAAPVAAAPVAVADPFTQQAAAPVAAAAPAPVTF